MDRTLYPSTNFGIGRVYLDFTFPFKGTTVDPGVASLDGAPNAIASIVYNGAAGTWKVTLKDTFNKVITVFADLDDTANDGAYCSVGNVTNEGTKTPITFIIYTRATGGGAIAPANGRVCRVSLALRNATAGKGIS